MVIHLRAGPDCDTKKTPLMVIHLRAGPDCDRKKTPLMVIHLRAGSDCDRKKTPLMVIMIDKKEEQRITPLPVQLLVIRLWAADPTPIETIRN